MRAFYAKLKGLCGRLALIHAVCLDPASREVGAESIGAAADLIDYFKGQAARVAPLFRPSPRRTPLERAERDILKGLSDGAIRTKRELQQLGNVPAAVFNQALEALIDVGRICKMSKPGKTKEITAFAIAGEET